MIFLSLKLLKLLNKLKSYKSYMYDFDFVPTITKCSSYINSLTYVYIYCMICMICMIYIIYNNINKLDDKKSYKSIFSYLYDFYDCILGFLSLIKVMYNKKEKTIAMAEKLYIKKYLHWEFVTSVDNEDDNGFSTKEEAIDCYELAKDFFDHIEPFVDGDI